MQKIIKIQFKGGLGNQLFQVAFAYILVKNYPNSAVIIDKSWFKKNKIREYLIDRLPISSIFSKNYNIGFKSRIIFYFHKIILNFLRNYNYLAKVISIIPKPSENVYAFLSKFGIFTDDNRSYIRFNNTSFSEITISGYFQDINYIKKFQEELQSQLIPRISPDIDLNLSAFKSEGIDSFSCLLRLDKDYIFNIDPYVFIKDALRISKQLNKKSNYQFFSDEQDKLKKIKLDIENPIFCNSSNPLIQLYLASRSNNFILSNSSFAWWAYFLSPHRQKTVIKPSQWIKNDDWNPGFLDEDKIINI